MTASKYIQHILLMLACLALCLTSCSDETEQPIQAGNEPASLTFSMKLPKATMTRGYSDPDSDLASWTDWEKYVDGQKLYRVTLFLIREDNTLVGFRDLYAGNSHLDGDNKFNDDYTEVHIAFDYDNPKHGSIEKLRRGNYSIMAVANYSGITANEKTYSGLTDFTSAIETLKEQFEDSGTTGIANFTADNYPAIFNATLSSGDDGICPQVPQPLTLVEASITLHPGINNYTGQLVRTYSRIRIAVENISTTSTLKVSSLSFSNNFAQRTAYLFSNHGSRYSTTKGSLTAGSTDAITKFAEVLIPKIDLEATSEDNKRVVFDAYVLESQNTDSYIYTLNMEYPEEKINTFEVASDVTAINTLDKLKTALKTTTYFAFQNMNSQKRFLKNNEDNTALATADVNLADISVDSQTLEPYVWQLVEFNNENNTCYIKTAGRTPYYIGNPEDGSKPVTLNPSSGPLFTFSVKNNNICMQSNTTPKYYINVNGSKQDIAGGYDKNDGGSQFDVFPINVVEDHPGYNKGITLTTIDPNTAAVNNVTNIARNDFIDVLVTISYHKEDGIFNIETQSWVKKDNYEIEFH